MKTILIALLLCCTALAQTAPPSGESQSSSKPAAALKAQHAKAKAAGERPDEGALADRSYTEKFFNVSYTLPENWVVKTPEMRQGLAGQENGILLLAAFAKKDKAAADAIVPSLTISAESVTANPDLKTAQDYFDMLSEVVTSKGFTVVNRPAEIDVGGVTFLRGDFEKQLDDSTAHQATMVAIRKGYVLTVTAISDNEEELTPLLNRLHIFAPPTLKKP